MAAALMGMAADRKFTLVIDAGHGGKDPGAKGKISFEKDINLKVALAFGQYVERNCSDVKVIYTRKTDVFVQLEERANIANRNKADLFISVHTNALEGGRISRGLETYTLGMHRAADNLNVAKRENSVILLEKNYKQTYAGFDPKSAESYIMFELMQDKYMANSVEMAKLIQSETCASSGRVNKGVHQAGFLVIRETSMPSCLIELGFITTPDEEEFLNTQEGQDKMARGIYNAFVKYKKKYGNVKMSADNDQRSDDNEDVLLALADQVPAVAKSLDFGDGMDNRNAEERTEQQIITDEVSSAPAEFTEQRAVRIIPSESVNTSVEVPQPTASPPVQNAPATSPAFVSKVEIVQPVSEKKETTTPDPKTEPTKDIKKDTKPTPTDKIVSEPPKEPVRPAAEPKKEPMQPVAEPKKEIPAQPVAEPKKEIPAQPFAEPKKEIPAQPVAEPKKEVPAQPVAEPKKEIPAQPVAEPKKEIPAQPVAEPKKEVPAQPVAEPKKEVPAQPVAEPKKKEPVAEPQKDPVKPTEEIPLHGPVFKVQIAATSQLIPTTNSVFQGVENIDSYEENGMFKYTVGATPDFDEISNIRKELLTKFPQAFIIAFKDGEKTDLAKAIREFKTLKNKKN